MDFWKLILKEIKILKIGIKFFKKNIGILEIKFERNWNFENDLRIGVLEIKFERNWNFENDLRIRVLNIKFKNWSFGN